MTEGLQSADGIDMDTVDLHRRAARFSQLKTAFEAAAPRGSPERDQDATGTRPVLQL